MFDKFKRTYTIVREEKLFQDKLYQSIVKLFEPTVRNNTPAIPEKAFSAFLGKVSYVVGRSVKPPSSARWKIMKTVETISTDLAKFCVFTANEDACCIIQEELCKNPKLKTGSRVQITTTRVVCRAAAVGGLVKGCEPETWQRTTVDFTPDERRAIYDHVVAVSAPRRVPPPPELVFSGPRPIPCHGPMDDKHGESLMAKMAAERDARRRRVSQKKVSTNRKSHLEVLREVIGNQMLLYNEWLGDTNADLAASENRPLQRDGSMASSEVQHTGQPRETTDLQANEPVQNQDYNRYRDKGRDDRERGFTSGRVEDSRRGVRFKEDNGGQREKDRGWESKEKDRYRERDGGSREYRRLGERDRDMEDNQLQRESHEYSEDKDVCKGRVLSWESKDKYRERREEKVRYRERYGDEDDKERERDVGYKDSGKEYARRRVDSSANSGRPRDEKNEFSRRDSSREEKRFREERNRNRDGDLEGLDDRYTKEKEERCRGRYSRQERDERIETRSGNIDVFVLKQERESDEEGPTRESDYNTVAQVKTEKDSDSVDKRGKRKHEKDYDWSEDSEKEAKKNKKKKHKKHKKHKKRKARSSSELDSS